MAFNVHGSFLTRNTRRKFRECHKTDFREQTILLALEIKFYVRNNLH